MRVITIGALSRFGERWPAAQGPLHAWYKLTVSAKWRDFSQVRRTFGQTDQVKVKSGQTVCVFDIGGNKFRLVAFVSYAKQKVYVLRIFTHKDYERGQQQWKEEL